MGSLGRFQFMLQQFSWGHFLIAAIVLNVLWYGFVLLAFYRKELSGVFGFLGENLRSADGHLDIEERKIVYPALEDNRGINLVGLDSSVLLRMERS